jgi:hypothetical protein
VAFGSGRSVPGKSRTMVWNGHSLVERPLEERQAEMAELPNAPGESVPSSDRFFPATIMGGHLHVRGSPDWGP